MTYVAGNPLERQERRVMVKAKYNAHNTYCGYPKSMSRNFKKTTMVKYYFDDKWYVLEDRVHLDDWRNVEGECEHL
eukprot:11207857-Karenia_brevis.AAC.1